MSFENDFGLLQFSKHLTVLEGEFLIPLTEEGDELIDGLINDLRTFLKFEDGIINGRPNIFILGGVPILLNFEVRHELRVEIRIRFNRELIFLNFQDVIKIHF